jgi:alpha-L-fucosidase
MLCILHPLPRTRFIPFLAVAAVGAALLMQPRSFAVGPIPEDATVSVVVSTASEPVAPGRFQPTWDSLSQYQVPSWFRDAKFGIWAHWGAQCEPEQGDWYARSMYLEGNPDYLWHLAHYGHPSQAGFKDVIHAWKAENWDPERLVALYKRAGAQYFIALANHCDNFDNWDSVYQPWNSVAVGPHKDLIAGWARAARAVGLPFGVSVHASHAWTWMEPAQGADTVGAKAGVAFDGNLTRADGKGKWWAGLDPQDLYAQGHARSAGADDPNKRIGEQWNWSDGASIPDLAYCQKFYNRTMDLINRYQPDLLYFDDTALPLWPVSDAGLKIAAHFYNSSMAWHDGQLRAVLFGKMLDEPERKALVWDIERGVPATSLPYAWQTDTCIGNWHYKRSLYDENGYKSAQTVVQMLADVASKNGNLLLNIPVRADGTLDDKEVGILEGIAAWMNVNGECIFGTRPWRRFGEGPASDGAPISAQGFNEGAGKPFTCEDVRFTTKGDVLYAIILSAPGAKGVTLTSLSSHSTILEGRTITAVTLLGSPAPLRWTQDGSGLVVRMPAPKAPSQVGVVVLRIDGVL